MSTEMMRPNRPLSASGHEQTVIDEWCDGRRYRLVLRQVGWIGQTGDFYTLDEDPSPTERGSFQPLLIIAHSDRIEDPPAEPSWFARLLRRFSRATPYTEQETTK